MIYKVKITYTVFNLERVAGSSMINKELKKSACLNSYNRCIDILINQ